MKVFISYRRSDDPHGTGRLYDQLAAHFGHENVFMDVDSNMPLGIDFRDHITNRIEEADAVLAIIGPRWLRALQENAEDSRDFVRLEIEAAASSSSAQFWPPLLELPSLPAFGGWAGPSRDCASPHRMVRPGYPWDSHRRLVDEPAKIRGAMIEVLAKRSLNPKKTALTGNGFSNR